MHGTHIFRRFDERQDSCFRWSSPVTNSACAPASGRSSPRSLRSVPFAEDAVAAYYCAIDPMTPMRVKGILFAALGYFVLPIDTLPDFILGVGFTDDLTVLVTALALIRTHMKPEHYDRAHRTIQALAHRGTHRPSKPTRIAFPLTSRRAIAPSASAVSSSR